MYLHTQIILEHCLTLYTNINRLNKELLSVTWKCMLVTDLENLDLRVGKRL